MAYFLVFWLSFHPIFCCVTWALGAAIVLQMYQLGLGTPQYLVPCILLVVVFHNSVHLLQKEVSLMSVESYTYL